MANTASQTADARMPVRRWRVLIAVPPGGFGAQLRIIEAWLDQNYGPLRWEAAPAGIAGVVNDALAFYFTSADDARAFVGRFGCGYRAAPSLVL